MFPETGEVNIWNHVVLLDRMISVMTLYCVTLSDKSVAVKTGDNIIIKLISRVISEIKELAPPTSSHIFV